MVALFQRDTLTMRCRASRSAGSTSRGKLASVLSRDRACQPTGIDPCLPRCTSIRGRRLCSRASRSAGSPPARTWPLKARPHLLDLLPIRLVGHPHDLVVAWILDLGDVGVVLPEQVIGDEAPLRMEDGRHVLQRERLGRVRIETGQEAADALRLVGRRVARRIERQRPLVSASRVVQPSLQVVLDANPVMVGGVGAAARRAARGDAD